MQINRREPTQTQPAGWGLLDEYQADIVATRTVRGESIDIIIQVEEDPINRRYGSSNDFIERVRRLADPTSDKRKALYVGAEKIKDMSRKVYQATVVLRNGYYFRGEDSDISLTPTETVLLKGFFDNLLVLDMEQEALLIPKIVAGVDCEGNPKQVVESIDTLPEFGFIETVYGGRDNKRFEEPVLNRDRSVKIPELRVARAVRIRYNQETGQPVNQDSEGQPLLF